MPVQPRREFGLRNLPAGQVRVTDVANLALSDQVVQCGERLLDRGVLVWPVQLI